MRRIRIDYKELRKAAYGYQPDIAARLEISTNSVISKINQRTKMTLDDLNAICEVVKRDPMDFLVIEEEKGTKKAA